MEKIKQRSAVKKKKKPTMFQATMHGLLLVAFWGLGAAYINFGLATAIRGLLQIIMAIITAYMTHIIYYTIEDIINEKPVVQRKEYFTRNWKKIKRGVPELTALIIALMSQLATPLPVIMFAVVAAELFGKLIWGGFGKNTMNPASAGFVLSRVLFGMYFASPVAMTVVDGITAATPVTFWGLNGWAYNDTVSEAMTYDFGGLAKMLFGGVAGPMAEMSRFATLLALCYMVYQKAIKWTIPLVFMGTVFIGATLIGVVHGFPLTYGLFHLLSGGVVFGAVFMATDPVTIPKNDAGKFIFALLLGTLTLTLRFRFVNFPEGVNFSILIMNLFAVYINDKTMKLNKSEKKSKWLVFALIANIGLIVLLLLSFTMPYPGIH